MADVFISYAHADIAFADGRGIQRVLVNLAPELSYWRDDRIAGGSDWNANIRTALEAAAVVVVIWSKTSWSSYWVRQEAFYAYMKGNLLPLCVDDVVLESPFNLIQSFRNDQAGYENLIRAVRERVRQE